jgi:hypothetical protein
VKLESIRGAARSGELDETPPEEARGAPPDNASPEVIATWRLIDFLAASCHRTHTQVLDALSLAYRNLTGMEGTKGAEDATALFQLISGGLRHVRDKKTHGRSADLLIIDDPIREPSLAELAARMTGMSMSDVVSAMAGLGEGVKGLAEGVKMTLDSISDFGAHPSMKELADELLAAAEEQPKAEPAPMGHDPRRGRPAKLTAREQRREQLRQARFNARRFGR